MSEEKKITAGTVIPIGMAALVLSTTIIGAWRLSKIVTQVDITKENVAAQQFQMQQFPSRQEYSLLSEQVNEVKGDVKEIKADIKTILLNKNR